MASRHGMTINDKQVQALRRMFQLLDRGGDASVIARTEPMRRFRATLNRIANGERFDFGGYHNGLEEPGRGGSDAPS